MSTDPGGWTRAQREQYDSLQNRWALRWLPGTVYTDGQHMGYDQTRRTR